MSQDPLSIAPSATASPDQQKPGGNTSSQDSTADGQRFSLLLASQGSMSDESSTALSVVQVNPGKTVAQQELPLDGKVLPEVVTTEPGDIAVQSGQDSTETTPLMVQQLTGKLQQKTDNTDEAEGDPLPGNVIAFSPQTPLQSVQSPTVNQPGNATAGTMTMPADDGGLANRSTGQLPVPADSVNSATATYQGETGGASLSAVTGDKGFVHAAASMADSLAVMTTTPQAHALPAQIQAPDKQVISLPVETPVQAKGWGEEVGSHVQWVLSQKLHVAQLRLNPPNLGSVDVRIQLQDDQLSVHFNASHALVRDSLDASLPRLRELMNDNGLNLINIDVAQHSYSEHRQDGNPAVAPGYPEQDEAEPTALTSVAEADSVLSRQGMLDLYA